MKKLFMVIMGLSLAVGSLAHADGPKNPKAPPTHLGTGPTLPPQVLGQIDGILSYCKKIDPRDEDKYEKLHRLVIADTNHRNSDDTEKNKDYQASVELVRSVFSRLSANDALKLCKDAVK